MTAGANLLSQLTGLSSEDANTPGVIRSVQFYDDRKGTFPIQLTVFLKSAVQEARPDQINSPWHPTTVLVDQVHQLSAERRVILRSLCSI